MSKMFEKKEIRNQFLQPQRGQLSYESVDNNHVLGTEFEVLSDQQAKTTSNKRDSQIPGYRVDSPDEILEALQSLQIHYTKLKMAYQQATGSIWVDE